MVLTIVDPCLTTTWIPSTVSAISTSINTSPSVAQTVTAFSTVVTFCGTPTYTTSPSYTWLTLDATGLIITTAPTNVADIGTYTISYTAALAAYPSIGTSTVSFVVTIQNCIVTSIALATAMTTTATFTFGVPLSIAFPVFTQTPACGYALTYTYTYDSVATQPAWVTPNTGTNTFDLSSSDITLVGTHSI